MNTKEIVNHVKAEYKMLTTYISDGIDNGCHVVLMYMIGDKAFKRPNWLGNNTSTYDAKRDKERIINEFISNPGMYSYGLLLGKQSAGFYLLCFDVDIDNDCKEVARKMIEDFLEEAGIDYRLETTKSKRYHIYFAVDEITEDLKKDLKKITEIDLNCEAIKYTYTKQLDGKIELLGLDRPHVVAVYNGIINKEKPVFADLPKVACAKDIKFNFSECKVEPELNNETIEKLIAFYKLVRKTGFFNGWDIERVVSAFCLKNNIEDDKIFQIFEQIYDETYDEKATAYIIERTKQKLDFVPSTGSVIYQAKQLLESGLLTDDEIKLVKDFLNSIKKSRKDSDEIELREYLKGVEEVYQLSSIDKQSEKKGTYYVEEYFIEKEDNGDKEVWYVEIESSEPNAIFKKHTIKSSPRFVCVKVDIKRIIKEKKTLFEVVINDEFTFTPSADFKRLDDLVEEIASECAAISPEFDMPRFKKYLRLKLKNFRRDKDNRKPCLISKTTGWSNDFKLFFHYDLNDQRHELHKDHPLYTENKAESFNQEEQHKLVFNLLKEGKLLAVLLTISTASIILKPFKLQPLTCIITGAPGAGKSSAALIATSLFYKSDDVLITPDATRVGLELKLVAMNSLPFIVDEGALAEDSAILKRLIFSVASKKARTRGKKDLSVETRDILSNVFWTSEVSDMDDVKRAGAYRRGIHLTVEIWDQFTNLFDIENMSPTPNELYSGCGVDYIKYAIENLDKIKERFNKETKDFGIKYKEITGIARTLYAGIIFLEEFYRQHYNIVSVSFTELRKRVDELLEEVEKTFQTAKDDVIEAVQQYLYANLNRFGQVDQVRNDDGDYKYVVIDMPKVKEQLGEYDKSTETFYITTNGLKTIAKELEKDRVLLHNALYKAGVISKTAEPKRSRISKITTRFYVVNFNNQRQPEPQPLPPPEQQQPPPEPPTQPEPTQPTEPEPIEQEKTIDEIDDAIVDAFSKTTYESKESPEKPATQQPTKTNINLDYVEEIMKFISSVDIAEKKGISLRGLTYEDVIEKIDYKPPDDNKLKELLMKFFFNQDESKNYRFRNKCILLDYLPTGKMYYKDKVEDASIILKEFTKEDVDIWLKVALLRYGSELKWIKNELTYMNEENVKGSELIKKFPALKFHGLDPF